jgi:hypothetical protein
MTVLHQLPDVAAASAHAVEHARAMEARSGRWARSQASMAGSRLAMGERRNRSSIAARVMEWRAPKPPSHRLRQATVA